MSKIFLDKDNNVVYEGYETHEIVANPTLAGTEGNLTGLQIGSTKYSVSNGGSIKYTAVIYSSDSFPGGYAGQITVEVDDNTLETYEDLVTYLTNKGYVSNDNGLILLNAVGYSSHNPAVVYGLYVESGEIKFVGYDGSNGTYTFSAPEEYSTFTITYLGQE